LKWWELSLEADREVVEAVAEVFSRFSDGGVAIEEPIQPSHDDSGFSIDLSLPVKVKTYLPFHTSSNRRLRQIKEALGHLSFIRPISEISVQPLANEDWASAWKAHFRPHRIGERLVIKPSWEEYFPNEGERVIILDPGLAFGTGLHPSTRMSLIAMEKHLRPGHRVLDMGTGSGILAIAAIKLGAQSVQAFDIDETAVAVARHNAVLNGVGGQIRVTHGSLGAASSTEERFDLVVANITATVIAGMAPVLIASIAPEGLLIASGIIAERLDIVKESLEAAGAQIVQVMSDEDWRTVLVRPR
jgi:ribosomal protein L11 methyltransferase